MSNANLKLRLIIMAVLAAFSVFSYLGKGSVNPVTGEHQRVSLTPAQEIAMGMRSAPELVAQFGGLSADRKLSALVAATGRRLVGHSAAARTDYPFSFHLLAEAGTVNAFALPGGPVFITTALVSRLENIDQLAGVLAHEIGHVLARHSAEHLAAQELAAGLTGAVVMGAGSYEMGRVAQMVGGFITMKYGREDELEADRLGLCLMAESGYRPEALSGVMRILAKANRGNGIPEFASTHPSSENRQRQITKLLADLPQACRLAASSEDRTP